MAHIRPVGVEEAAGEVKELYDSMIKARGSVPNLFQLLGHDARMLGPAIDLALFAASEDSRVPARHKQLAYLAASRLNGCQYCLRRHAVAGAKAGLTPLQVEKLLGRGDLTGDPAFDHRERLLILYAEELTRNIRAGQTTQAAMRENFDEVELLEIAYVVATANMFNRLTDGLHVELEPEFNRTFASCSLREQEAK